MIRNFFANLLARLRHIFGNKPETLLSLLQVLLLTRKENY